MTRNEFEQITKWLEANANASKFRNVYEMLERFKLEFNHLLKEEQLSTIIAKKHSAFKAMANISM